MRLPAGTYRLGPEDGSLVVRTFREGMAAKVGHDLVLEATRWEAALELADDPARSAIELTADPSSLEIREALRGLKPLTDADRGEIARNIESKVLGDRPIGFRSRAVRPGGDDRSVTVEGDLAIAGSTRAVTVRVDLDDDGRLSATVPLRQSDWGIKPYRGLFGALKVRDELEVAIDVRLAPA